MTGTVGVVMAGGGAVADPPDFVPVPLPVPVPDPEDVLDPDCDDVVGAGPAGGVGGGTKVNSPSTQSVGCWATTVSTVGDDPKAHTESPAAVERQA